MQVGLANFEKAPLDNPTVAGSIFNAVANQYSDGIGSNLNIPTPPHPMNVVGVLFLERMMLQMLVCRTIFPQVL